jgi:predicted TIM-barrel fold metal-dependent hydrolase
MMHLEVYVNDNYGRYWPGMEEQILEYYEAAGIDKGVILTTWTPSRESNDRTLHVYEKYPNRFIPFGHVRPVDKDWESELKRIAKPPWKGLKLHEGELRAGGRDLRNTTKMILRKVAEYGIPVVKIHLQKWPVVQEIVEEFKGITFIFPHMGAYNDPSSTHVKEFCELARNRDNVFLDTAGFSNYWEFPEWFRLAGTENICFASDGFYLSPLVEKAKVETVGMPTPSENNRLDREELDKILGGNIARILKL